MVGHSNRRRTVNAGNLMRHGKVVKKRMRTTETPKVEESHVGWFEKSVERLSISFVPDEFVGREKETAELRDTLQSIGRGSRGGSVYVSGLPGTGKTLTVTKVIAELQVTAIWLNAASLRDAKSIYSEIAVRSGAAAGRSNSSTSCEGLARELDSRYGRLVIVLDELDFLITRDLKVLYSLFELPFKCTEANVTVVGIANAVDLPERVLPWLKACGRMPRTVVFSPYSSEVLEKIVRQRVVNGAIDAPAVSLCSKKVASVTGDARMALDVCRAALTSVKHLPNPPPTLLKEVTEIFESRSGPGKLSAVLDNLPLQQQVVLCSFVRKVSGTEPGRVTLQSLYDDYLKLSARAGTTALSFSQFDDICAASLVHTGLVEIGRPAGGRAPARKQRGPTGSVRARVARLCVDPVRIRDCFQQKRLLKELVS